MAFPPRITPLVATVLAGGLLTAPVLASLRAAEGPADASPVTLVTISTQFNQPVGIDEFAPDNRVVMSVNYPDGRPRNFERVDAAGKRTTFSDISGWTDEVKIATVRASACQGGFIPGELFAGTGDAGVIARIHPDGSYIRQWVRLPGEDGLMRGSLFQDRYCSFGGDLIVVTTTGGVWRVTAAGKPTRIAHLGTHLEGLTTVPNEPTRYGPWAGTILAGAEEEDRVYAVTGDGRETHYRLGVSPEDIDIVPPESNFFGVDQGGRRLLGAPASAWLDKVGDVVIADEDGPLWDLRWDSSVGSFKVAKIAQIQQWEHVTFTTAGIVEIPGITPQPSATSPASATPTPSPASTRSPSPTLAPSLTPTLPSTSTPSAVPTATATSSPTAVPSATSTPVPMYLPVTLNGRCERGREHADVALVIDASTSMLERTSAGRTKMDAARDAVRAFVALLAPASDQAAIVWFNDTAGVEQTLTGSHAALDAALGRIQNHEHTRIDLGLDAARAELTSARHRAGNRAVIVLLTDGRANPVTPGEVLDAAERAKAAGQTIFTIGLGNEVDSATLGGIASRSGYAFRTADAEALAAIYRDIAATIPCGEGSRWP